MGKKCFNGVNGVSFQIFTDGYKSNNVNVRLTSLKKLDIIFV